MRGVIRRWVTEDETRTVVLATNDMGEANERPEPARPDARAHGAAALEAAFLTIVGRGAWAGA